MAKATRHIAFFLLTALLSAATGLGQSGFYVPQKGKLFFAGDTATIFSNVINQGQLGLGKSAVVNFRAGRWQNETGALITDESNNGNGLTGIGGTLRFLQPDTALFAPQQWLAGGYNAATRAGASFPNITIDNPYGLRLAESSARIRRRLHFNNGHLYTEDNILVVGDGNPGSITGYDDNRFIVTGASAAGSGFLLREQISVSDGLVAFPIGSAAGSYTPAALQLNAGMPDDFYARVSDSLPPGTPAQDMKSNSVNKSWQIGKLQYPGQGETDIYLQHLVADEGAQFRAKRQNAYIAQYVGGKWDTGYPQLAPTAGTVTTGAPSAGGGLNMRRFGGTLSNASLFTKLTGNGDTSLYKTRLWFSAYRTDYRHVWVYWNTFPEINQKYFIVQRRLSNEAVFTNRDSLPSKALNGASFRNIDYGITDPNNYSGVSFYRLLMISYNGDTTWSNIVAVGGRPDKYGFTVWPNPAPGRFFIGISSIGAVKSVVVYNAIGQLMLTEAVDNRGFLEMYLRTPGAYMVTFIGYDGSVLDTKKLIIAGN